MHIYNMRSPYLHSTILIAFLVNILGPMPLAKAQDYHLPLPGEMVPLSSPVDPPILKGIKVNPDNPFKFDFILDPGDKSLSPGGGVGHLNNDQLKDESNRLIKYFLASLTIPENDLWVNLSPYEKDRIVPNSFGLTEMGRDLLAEDYILKQITASLIYPEEEIGKKFWKRVYEEAEKKYGTTNVPVNTFNKVWIVPEKAVVFENVKTGTAYVVDSKLKVMLEQDYLSLEKHEGIQSHYSLPLVGEKRAGGDVSALGSQIVREVIIPQLTREVNKDKNFSHLRQVYNSLILATWYKNKIKNSILGQVYADKYKIAGVRINDPQEKEKIYQRYLKAFKKGVFNYIKNERLSNAGIREMVPRKYFSGGEVFKGLNLIEKEEIVNDATINPAMLSELLAKAKNLIVVDASIAVVSGVSVVNVPNQRSSRFLIQTDLAMATFTNVFSRLLGVQKPSGGNGGVDLGIDSDRLNMILAENARYHGITWNNDGARLFVDVFDRYLKNMHPKVLQGGIFGDFPSLSGLFTELQSVDSKDAFGFTSKWMIQRISTLSNETGKEDELFMLLVDATRFVQVVLKGELKESRVLDLIKYEHVRYNKDRPSMVSLLKNDGWNCQAISDLTAVLMGLWGARGVSVVGVLENSEGRRYAKDEPGHAANLVRGNNNKVTYVDQGHVKEYKGPLEVINNLGEVEMSITELPLNPGVEGLTIDRIYALLKAKNDFYAIEGRLSNISGLKVVLREEITSGGRVFRYEIETMMTNENVNGVARSLEAARDSLVELLSRVVNERSDLMNVSNLNLNFRDNLSSTLDSIQSSLSQAQEMVGRNRAAQGANTIYNTFIDKCFTLGLLIRNGNKIGYQITDANRQGYINLVPNLLKELEGYSTIADPTFQLNRQMLIELLGEALREAGRIQSIALTFNDLQERCRQLGLITVQGKNYSVHVSSETAQIYISGVPTIMPELDRIIATRGQDVNLVVNVRELKRFLEQALRQAKEMFEEKNVVEKLNSFAREFNENQRNSDAMSNLRNEIRAFVQGRRTIIDSMRLSGNKKVLDGFREIYVLAGGDKRDFAMATMNTVMNGGIDLTPASTSLQTRTAGGEIIFHIDAVMLKQLQNAPGFVPVIINIQPLQSLAGFLGIKNSSK